MKLTNLVKTGYLVAALAALPLIASAAGRTLTQSTETVQLINDARDDAYDVSTRADRLFAMAQTNGFDWQGHAAQLTYLKYSVNDLAVKLNALNDLRASQTSLQGKELDRALELAHQVAVNTTGAIQYVGDRPQSLWNTTYRKYAENADDAAGQLSRLLDNWASYLRTHDKEVRLEKALGE